MDSLQNNATSKEVAFSCYIGVKKYYNFLRLKINGVMVAESFFVIQFRTCEICWLY